MQWKLPRVFIVILKLQPFQKKIVSNVKQVASVVEEEEED